MARGAIADPIVDRQSALLRICKIQPAHPRSVDIAKQVEIRRLERIIDLSPDRIGNTQCKARLRERSAWAGRIEVETQGIQGGMQLILGQGEAQCICDLPLGLPSCTGLDHRHRS